MKVSHFYVSLQTNSSICEAVRGTVALNFIVYIEAREIELLLWMRD